MQKESGGLVEADKNSNNQENDLVIELDGNQNLWEISIIWGWEDNLIGTKNCIHIIFYILSTHK